MPDFRLKREESDFDFVVRSRFDGCVGRYSSTRGIDAEDGDLVDDGAPDLVDRRRRRSALDCNDIAESSAAARRQSRILSRWVARHAEEMITNIERRNREAELMALAGLHTVSTLDSSFLRESRRSPASVERPVAARASTILQMWRELEDISGAREMRSSSTDRIGLERRETAESDDNSYNQWNSEAMGSSNREANMDDNVDRGSSRELSPELGDGERERVRQIAQGWMAEERMRELSTSDLSPRNDSSRLEWLGEVERERVRLVREWVQMASEQRDGRARSDELAVIQNSEGSVMGLQAEQARRTSPRIRGRQARLDVIMRMARERQLELQGLSEARAVSGFAHRGRIQSLLRGRFLRNGSTTVEDAGPNPVAARELGQLRRGHPVSVLREGFHFRPQSIATGQHVSQADNISSSNVADSRRDQLHSTNTVELTSSNLNQSESRTEINENQTTNIVQLESNRPVDAMEWQGSADQAELLPDEASEHTRREWQQSTEEGLNEWHDDTEEEYDTNWRENTEQDWFRRMPEDGVNGHIPDSDDWHDNDSQVTVENWLDEPSRASRHLFDIPISRVNRFAQSDTENIYSIELRELLSRRSVSNLLHSEFRDSLDQLIQSYIQRQGRDWDLPLTSPTPASTDEDLDQHREETIQQRDPSVDREDNSTRPPAVIPTAPAPPLQPLWHSVLHHNSLNGRHIRRTDIELDAVNDLRAELGRLQQGMSNMQRMLEACMDMQLELHRSVRQEVSAALNRSPGEKGLCDEWSSDGSKWINVKNGTCCVCCDAQIDTLLYRCGHMCSCAKCANELVRAGGNCPLCRAPIIEVIRAYSIL